jgi:hypothetical protein
MTKSGSNNFHLCYERTDLYFLDEIKTKIEERKVIQIKQKTEIKVKNAN